MKVVIVESVSKTRVADDVWRVEAEESGIEFGC